MSNNLVSRGVRGAITVEHNTREEIENATVELLSLLIEKNKIDTSEISHAVFSLTRDIDSAFPAEFARKRLEWDHVPMICTNEVLVPDSLPLCIRVLLVINTALKQNEVHHIYLKGAARLRPDLAGQ